MQPVVVVTACSAGWCSCELTLCHNDANAHSPVLPYQKRHPLQSVVFGVGLSVFWWWRCSESNCARSSRTSTSKSCAKRTVEYRLVF